MRGDAVNGRQIAGARELTAIHLMVLLLADLIVKNKLFLFVNGEMAKTPTVVNRWRASTDGVAMPTIIFPAQQ